MYREIPQFGFYSTISIWEFSFFCGYGLEIILKIFAFGFRKYFRSLWNRYYTRLMAALVLY